LIASRIQAAVGGPVWAPDRLFALAIALVLFGCGATSSEGGSSGEGGAPEVAAPEEAAPLQPGAGAGGAPQNRAMGTGEPRIPQPFTREQRYLEAARRGDRAVLERSLELGVPVDAKDDLGRSALLLAARDAGQLEIVRFLHERGAPLDEPDLGGRTALSFAAEAGRIDIVGYLLDRGARVDLADKQGRTPFFHAVVGNQLEVARALLARGAAVDVRDRFEDTPLVMACAKGYAEMAAFLLEHGADPSVRDQEGRTLSQRSAPGVEVCRRSGPA